MAVHNIRGKKGEELALQYLISCGYQILYRNWRYGYYETDIIASKNGILRFVEVKTRNSIAFGYPEESISRKKFANLQYCAEHFMELHPDWKHIQFDVVSIIMNKDNTSEYYVIEDFYF